MEKQGYRDNLQMLSEKSGGKQILTLREAAGIVGIDQRTAKRLWGSKLVTYENVKTSVQKRYYISLPDLARAISG